MKNLNKKASETAFAGRLTGQGESDGTYSSMVEPEAVNFPVVGSIPTAYPNSVTKI